jgi:F0F1-type ATP synthase assembly protein I
MAFGMEFAGIVVAGVLIGYWLDARLGTPPLFTLLLTLGGMGGALYRLIWNLKQSRSVSDLEAPATNGSGPKKRTPDAGPSSQSNHGD